MESHTARLAYRAGHREGSHSWLLLGAAGGGAPGQPGRQRTNTGQRCQLWRQCSLSRSSRPAHTHICTHTQTHTEATLCSGHRLGDGEEYISSPAEAAMGTAPRWTHPTHHGHRHTVHTHTHPTSQPYPGTDTPLCHTHTLTISPLASGTVIRPHHTCANSHNGLHPEPPSGFLNGIHLSTLPAGHHSCTHTAYSVTPGCMEQSKAQTCLLGGSLSR